MRAGDALCELITEKTTFDLPAEAEGCCAASWRAKNPLCRLATSSASSAEPDEALPDVDAETSPCAEPQEANAANAAPERLERPVIDRAASSAATDGPAAARGSRVRATPAARRAARESAALRISEETDRRRVSRGKCYERGRRSAQRFQRTPQ